MKIAGRLFLLSILVPFSANVRAADLCPEREEDYGSGPKAIAGLYYPGGIPKLGLAVGHPNSLARDDRAVVKFNLTPFLLSQQPVATATLQFSVAGFQARDSLEQQTVKIDHLNYTLRESLAGTDLIHREVETVDSVAVNRLDIQSGRSGVYSVDVTSAVNADIKQGRKFCGFRLSNALTEEGNPDARPLCVVLGKDFSLKTRPRSADDLEQQPRLDLVRDGKPLGVIVIDRQAPDSVRLAARTAGARGEGLGGDASHPGHDGGTGPTDKRNLPRRNRSGQGDWGRFRRVAKRCVPDRCQGPCAGDCRTRLFRSAGDRLAKSVVAQGGLQYEAEDRRLWRSGHPERRVPFPGAVLRGTVVSSRRSGNGDSSSSDDSRPRDGRDHCSGL